MGEWVPWTDEAIEQLRVLLAEGLSGTEIALRLHVTRSAVIGKAHRAGFVIPAKTRSPTRQREEREAVASRPRLPRLVPMKQPKPHSQRGWQGQIVRPKTVKPLADAPVAPPEGALTIMELPLSFTRCRHPYGAVAPFMYCGQETVEGHPFCAAHEAINYRPVGSKEP